MEGKAVSKQPGRVAFILFSDPVIFPPTMNAAAILGEHGYEVDIICLRHPTGDSIPTPPNTQIDYRGRLRKGFLLRLDFIRFCFHCILRSRREKYDWIFAYNMTGIVPGYLASRFCNSRLLYHVHDTTEVKRQFSFYGMLKFLELYLAKKVDILSFPQVQRAERFSQQAGFQRVPTIVTNGPRRSWGTSVNADPEVAALKQEYGRVALYQGGLNWKRGLRQLIESMPLWKSRAGLVLVGNIDLQPTFPQEAMQLASLLGVAERIIVRSTVPYLELPSITSQCDVGIGVLASPEQNKNFNIKYLAGASNKLAEYMACGLPVVVPNTEGYRQFIEMAGVGVLADVTSCHSIAVAVDSCVVSGENRDVMSAKAKALFDGELNFDRQFQPILEALESQPEMGSSRG